MNTSLHQQHKYLNIVSNTCMGGFCYAILGIKPQNPFIWNAIFPQDFLYLVKNFNSINFLNFKHAVIKASQQKDDIHGLIVDEKMKVWFMHHKKDEKATTVQYDKANVYYCNIEKYLADNWKSRVATMKVHQLQHILMPPHFVALHIPEWTPDGILELSRMQNANITFITSDAQYLSLQRSKFNVICTDAIQLDDDKILNWQRQHECAKLFLNAIGIQDIQTSMALQNIPR